MRYALAFVSLASTAAAAPMMRTDVKREPGMQMVQDTAYLSCPSYASSVDEAGAKMGMAKRLPDIKMAQDIDYTSYPSYAPYKTYGPYASAVDEAGAKTDMAKRHEMMIDGSMMTEDNMKRDMPMMDTESTTRNIKRDNPDGTVGCWKRNEMQSAAKASPGGQSYGAYVPYHSYGGYTNYITGDDAEDAKANENKE